jgi:hypothetical protein
MMRDDWNELIEQVKSRLRKKCWYVSCGGSVGTTFQLVLGDKVRRDVPVRNPAHSDDFRNYEGEANLYVWCSWRLDSPEGPLTSSAGEQEHVVLGLEDLVGRAVIDVRVDLPGWDLHLQFSGGRNLHVFCDQIAGDSCSRTNWDLVLTDKSIDCEASSKIVVEPRS